MQAYTRATMCFVIMTQQHTYIIYTVYTHRRTCKRTITHNYMITLRQPYIHIHTYPPNTETHANIQKQPYATIYNNIRIHNLACIQTTYYASQCHTHIDKRTYVHIYHTYQSHSNSGVHAEHPDRATTSTTNTT